MHITHANRPPLATRTHDADVLDSTAADLPVATMQPTQWPASHAGGTVARVRVQSGPALPVLLPSALCQPSGMPSCASGTFVRPCLGALDAAPPAGLGARVTWKQGTICHRTNQ